MYPSAIRSISTKITAESTSIPLKNEPIISTKVDKTPNIARVYLINLFSVNNFMR